MKRIILLFCLLSYLPFSYACPNAALTQKNIAIVKNMFSEFAEGLDINKLDTYYTKSFILESNGQHYNYEQYKNLEGNIYKTLKSLKVVKYDDVFSTTDKVVSRMTIKLVNKDGKAHEFQVILVALIKDNKIDKIWEITYPEWSDKLPKNN